MHGLLTFAAEAAGEETSHVPFYVAGILLTVWALAVSLMGVTRYGDFPSSASGARRIMGVSVVLVVAAMATSVIVA